MSGETLLLELGTEELPPKALASLSAAFAEALRAGIEAAGVDHGQVRPLASPRRLAVLIEAVAASAPDRQVERLGPPKTAAFDADGEPTPAAAGFARSCGVEVADLEVLATDKGERLAYAGVERGQALADLLPEIAAAAVKALPIPKRMRWGASEAAFVRPVHWLVALHGEAVIPMELFGCRADRRSYGHRFHHPDAIVLDRADEYVAALREAHVLVDSQERCENVRRQVEKAAAADGGQALIEDDLLAEVTALVEWPVALAGRFEERFLELPREVLVATLQGHQRYFPVAGGDGHLLPAFVTVANIDSRDPARVIAGNERVVRPRLADALFFWNQDRRQGLDVLAKGLERVTFQRDLGSLAAKSERVAELAAWLADEFGVEAGPVTRAAALAKADLLTEMVDEFPELQGTMGRYYAQAAGEDPAVALALEEQYAPRGAGAPIPESPTGRVLALADKLDTLAGIFCLGKRPSGEKDPFALRRAALGVLRIAIEGDLDLSLEAALSRAVSHQPTGADDAVVEQLLAFHLDRLRAYYADRGVPTEIFEAVAALGLDRPRDFARRIGAVRGFLEDAAAKTLCAAHKRVRNILKSGNGRDAVDPKLLREPAERQLYDSLETLRPALAASTADGDYTAALHRLAELGPSVDEFFDQVLVMAEEADVRANRLALLATLDTQCRAIADISRLSAEE